MVGIKDMETPKDCKKCPLMGTDGAPKDFFKPMMCVAIWATKHEIKHCIDGKKRDDCPLVEIEECKIEKFEKIEQIINEWNNDASHSFEDMCKINMTLRGKDYE